MTRVAVDVGGTFTDAVAVGDDGEFLVMKLKSTPEAPEQGFLSSVSELISANRIPASNVSGIVHVGTIGTNLFLGQVGLKLPRVALITTNGFRDILEIGRQNRPELYNVFFKRPPPLVARRLRLEVSERVDSNGKVLKEVSHDDSEGIGNKLKGELVESVAISFLNSYLNSANEKSLQRFLNSTSSIPVFTSVDVDPEHREYERTSTTVVNAVLAPIVSKYLSQAQNGLRLQGILCDLQVLSSSGGLVDVDEVKDRPILTLESGPAAGVAGAAEVAKILGIKRAISFDMGGTSAKAGCVVDYTPLVVPEIEVGGRVHMGRSVKGSGYPIRSPSIDLAEVSAGGGTIIWVDKAESLRVGPISAGASPGPACYDVGGSEPTVTDANLVLGRIGPSLLGGKLMLHEAAAKDALEKVGERAGLGLHEVAAASLKLVNLQMARAIFVVSLERGLDPREFTLVSFGGAGPMHACELAEEVGISTVVVPPWPGLFSALSMLLSDMKYTYLKGLLCPLGQIDNEEIERLFASMTAEAIRKLETRGLGAASSVVRSVDLRYAGQGYELEVEISEPFNKEETIARFENKHNSVYGYSHSGEDIEVTALRISLTLPVKRASLPSSITNRERTQNMPPSERRCWFSGTWFETGIYLRDSLGAKLRIKGPAIIEEYDSTIVVPPYWECESGNAGCLILRRAAN